MSPKTNTVTVEKDDRISDLPDCLLLKILSRLPSTKEAIRACTLSKRWIHLWPTLPDLIFRYDMPIWEPNQQRLRDFFLFVDKSLTPCRQSNLNKVQLHTPYYVEFQSQVTNLIRYAIKWNVQDLDLQLSITNEKFELNQFFFTNSSFTQLKLSGCVLNPSGAISWNKLTSLDIFGAKLDEDLIQNIITGSPLLETLHLKYCYGFGRIDITSNSVKSFLLDGHTDIQNDIIEINAPYILSLALKNALNLSKLLLLNVSSLVEAKLNYWKYGNYGTKQHEEMEEEILKGVIMSLHHVKELKAGYSCTQVNFHSFLPLACCVFVRNIDHCNMEN